VGGGAFVEASARPPTEPRNPARERAFTPRRAAPPESTPPRPGGLPRAPGQRGGTGSRRSTGNGRGGGGTGGARAGRGDRACPSPPEKATGREKLEPEGRQLLLLFGLLSCCPSRGFILIWGLLSLCTRAHASGNARTQQLARACRNPGARAWKKSFGGEETSTHPLRDRLTVNAGVVFLWAKETRVCGVRVH
jgi:hypothetical protein